MSKDKYVLTHFFESNNFDFLREIGEITYPSLAITNNDAISEFGDCCFILNEDLLKNDETIIFDRDAYTIRPPKFYKKYYLDINLSVHKIKEFINNDCLNIDIDDSKVLINIFRDYFKNIDENELYSMKDCIKFHVFKDAISFIKMMDILNNENNDKYKEIISDLNNISNDITHEDVLSTSQSKLIINTISEYHSVSGIVNSFTDNIRNNLSFYYYFDENMNIYSSDTILSNLEKDLKEKFNNNLVQSEGVEFNDSDVTFVELKSHTSQLLKYDDLKNNLYKIKNLDDVLLEDNIIIKDFHDSIFNSGLFKDYDEDELNDVFLLHILHCFQNKEYYNLVKKLEAISIIDGNMKYSGVSESEQANIHFKNLAKNKREDDKIDNSVTLKINYLYDLMNDVLNKFKHGNTVYFEVKIKDVMKINSNNVDVVIMPKYKAHLDNYVKFKKFLDEKKIKCIEYGDREFNRSENYHLLLKSFEKAKSKYNIKLHGEENNENLKRKSLKNN